MTIPASRQISSWREAENNARDWMISWGYNNAHLTGSGSDGGIDIRSTGAIAQVKFEAKQVGRPQLQQLVGARARNISTRMFFFTGAGYSSLAIAYGEEMNIALFHFKLDGTVSAVNRAGREVMRSSSQSNAAETPTANMAESLAATGCLFLLTIVCCSIVVVGILADAAFKSIEDFLFFTGALIATLIFLIAFIYKARTIGRK